MIRITYDWYMDHRAEFVQRCEFEYMGKTFRGETLANTQLMGGTTNASGVVKIGETQVDFVDVPDLDPILRGLIQTLLFREEIRILLRGVKHRLKNGTAISSYHQDSRWGPTQLTVNDDSSINHARMRDRFQEPLVDPSLYTPEGLWVDSQSEYLGRELLL